MFYFDPMYMIMVFLPVLLIGGLASLKTKLTFKKYSKIASSRGITGAQAAEEMLHSAGVYDVAIELSRGFLSDHYDPRARTLRLSKDVYYSESVAAVGIACHEAGHALQHANNYAALGLRSGLVPITNICSGLYILPILLGAVMHIPILVLVGFAMCGMTLVFALVTLPVEWDASRRAKIAMVDSGMLTGPEAVAAGHVLNAAFMTYVAAVVSALLVMLYWAIRLGLIGGRD